MKYDTWIILISRINVIWLLNMLMLESCLKGQIGKLAFLSGFSAAFKENHLCIALSNVLSFWKSSTVF